MAHSGRWYVTGADPGIGEDRTFRLDRIADARTLPGSFEPPAGLDPAKQRPVRARRRPVPARGDPADPGHDRADPRPAPRQRRDRDGTAGRGRPDPDPDPDSQAEPWFLVELQAERLDWLPPLLASLDRPFAVERQAELRDLIAALADRLAASARRDAPGQ